MNEYIERMREPLRSWEEAIHHKHGEIIRQEIKEYTEKNYKPKHTDKEYMDYLASLSYFDLSVNGFQNHNQPYVYTFFSRATQHIMGDSLKQILDKILGDS